MLVFINTRLLKSLVREHYRTLPSGKRIFVKEFERRGIAQQRKPSSSEQQSQKESTERPLSYYSAYIRRFRPILKTSLDQLDQISNSIKGATVTGRLKAPDSLKEKLESRKKGRPIESITDIVGARITVPDMNRYKQAISQIEKKFKVLERDDYVEKGHPSGSGYRSHHFLVEVKGKPVEIQIRTPRQTRWADWAHDTIYKGHLRDHPDVLNYARAMSEHYYAKDLGKMSNVPDCPPPVKKENLCLE